MDAQLAALKQQIETMQGPMDGTLSMLLGQLTACSRELRLRTQYEALLEAENEALKKKVSEYGAAQPSTTEALPGAGTD
jgi:hypothetical protein